MMLTYSTQLLTGSGVQDPGVREPSPARAPSHTQEQLVAISASRTAVPRPGFERAGVQLHPPIVFETVRPSGRAVRGIVAPFKF